MTEVTSCQFLNLSPKEALQLPPSFLEHSLPGEEAGLPGLEPHSGELKHTTNNQHWLQMCVGPSWIF